MAKLSFDASKVAPQKPMDPVPKGWYPVVITESSVEPTKSDPKNGVRLNLEVEIIDGEFKGRKAWDGINTKNKSPMAQKIGEEQLSAICHATGVIKMADTAELHGKPFEIKLGYEEERQEKDSAGNVVPGGNTYDARNTFKAFRPLDGQAAQAAGASAGGKVPSFVANAGKTAAPAGGKPTAGAFGGGAKAPPKPGAKATPAPEPEPVAVGGPNAERPFYVFLDNDSQEKTGAEIAVMLGQGMPEDTPVMAQDDDKQEWKTAADFEIAAHVEPAPVEEAPAPPAKPKGPAAPAGKAAGSKTPPWQTKK